MVNKYNGVFNALAFFALNRKRLKVVVKGNNVTAACLQLASKKKTISLTFFFFPFRFLFNILSLLKKKEVEKTFNVHEVHVNVWLHFKTMVAKLIWKTEEAVKYSC